MLQHYLLPLFLCVSQVTQSSSIPHGTDELAEQRSSLFADKAITRRLEYLRKSMEVDGVGLEEQQHSLEGLRRKAAQRSKDASKPLSKKQRRLQYVNELLSHNSDLKKQSLIKVINNLNKCGVECTLSTQGKGSHITLSVDGKKHTISSKMEITPLKQALKQSGVEFSVSEDKSEIRSDQTLKEFEIRVGELAQLLKSLDMGISELQKEQKQLKGELDAQEENVEEMRESYLFATMVDSVTDLIIHRSFDRRNKVWEIYDAVMADLPHYGQQWDFKRAVKKALRNSEKDWGRYSCPMYEIQVCSTKALQTRVHYYDALAAFFETERELGSIMPISQMIDSLTVDMFTLGYHDILDGIRFVDPALLDYGMKSFSDENDNRKPDLFEFSEIMDASKMEEPVLRGTVIFGMMDDLLNGYQSLKEETEMKPEHKHTLQVTEQNPNDDPEYLKSMSDRNENEEIPFITQIVEKMSDSYDNQYVCELSRDWVIQASKMWEHDKDEGVRFIEETLDQTSLGDKGISQVGMFGDIRRTFGVYLYNQAMQKIRKMHKTKQFSASPLIDIERSERIFGLMWHTLKDFSRNQLYVTLLCLELGDRQRAIQEAGRVGSDLESNVMNTWSNLLQMKFNFNLNDKEILQSQQDWIDKIKREMEEWNAQMENDPVRKLEELMSDVNKTWEYRRIFTLNEMIQMQQKMQDALSQNSDQVWMEVRDPELRKKMQDMKQLFDDYIKRAKGETVENKYTSKKKKTQKRGKKGKH